MSYNYSLQVRKFESSRSESNMQL